MSPQFTSLVDKLKEIFQIDKPELDFGIYRILHARRTQIEDFLKNRLAAKVQTTLAGNAAAEEVALKNALEEAIENARQLGIDDPTVLPKVRELKEKLAACSGSLQAENEVYSHLLTFFSRYYEKGDFISQRRYKGDTYAIPYSGEEVKLHWANADQYYIKSGESFSNYDFTLPDGGKVHFRLVSAELTKDNIKDNDAVRCFVLWNPDEAEGIEEGSYPPSCIEEKDGELYVYFQYRRFKKVKNLQAKVSDNTVAELEKLLDGRWDILQRCNIWALAPTEKDKKRTIFRKYLDAYTAKNTSDYFIHKDLQGFLSRELDFYIKNEMMHLDDIQNASAFSHIEKNLRMIQAVRSIASELIVFMAQIENFQKKLWLKKKFVVQCDYCLTMDMVPQELHAEVLNNPRQQAEWSKLKTIEGSLVTDARMVDTKFFDEEFKAKLFASIDNLDERCDGLLIHSENFGALNLISSLFKNKVKATYIDPPYNTGSDGFLYKDGYFHATWISMLHDRLALNWKLSSDEGVLFTSIDDNEVCNARMTLTSVYGEKNLVANFIVVRSEGGGLAKQAVIGHDYLLTYAKDIEKFSPLGKPKDIRGQKVTLHGEEYWIETDWFREVFGKYGTCHYEDILKFYDENKKLEIDQGVLDGKYILIPKKGKHVVGRYRKIADDTSKFYTVKHLNKNGAEELGNLGLRSFFSYPKPLSLVRDFVQGATIMSKSEGNFILDYFAGSGTTAHAVINLNREDGGNRKYILVEMGDHFDSVLMPRIKKEVYSPDWKDGNPLSANKGISHCFKYMSLESYEDTLNNIELQETRGGDMLNSLMQEEYLLKYMMDIESRGSIINTDSFRKPFDYSLKIAVDSSGASESRKVDLVETFNYLLGLHVESQNRKLGEGYVIVEGQLPNGKRVLIFWRDCEKINSDTLNETLKKKSINPKDKEFDYIYVNGDHSIANLKINSKEATSELKVRSIEEEFLTRMFEGE